MPPDGQIHTLQVLSRGEWRDLGLQTPVSSLFDVFYSMVIIHCWEEKVNESACVFMDCEVCFGDD